MDRQYYIYILTNHRNTVLYTGITNDLCRRLSEHKQELIKGFSKKYHAHNLLYYEIYSDAITAIEREKQIKGYSRKKKNALILKNNPQLVDLTPRLCQ